VVGAALDVDHSPALEALDHLELESVVLVVVPQSAVLVEAHGENPVLLVEQKAMVDAPTHGLKLRNILSVDLLMSFVRVQKRLQVSAVLLVLYLKLHAERLGLVLDALVQAQFAPGNSAPHPKTAVLGEGGRVKGSASDLLDFLVGLVPALDVQLRWVVQVDHFLTDAQLALQPLAENENLPSAVEEHGVRVASLDLDELEPLSVDNRLVVVNLIRPLYYLKSFLGNRKSISLNTT